ncbi:peptidoglycan-binding protein [Streptomyces sp. NBC_01136]|uniref:peptidoglycan-binding domain-containing protein n=1 Tax=unclassified Streptomyces TaxID=2593676 RepID=UPI003253EE2F|nr:peptidoglycan-binding protein [Streptomyces sp. NBC_01136]
MTEPNGHICPECAAPRTPDGTPSCACTQRASEALREARTAEAAAAEDFDPLRIRPYVELGTGNALTGGEPSHDTSTYTSADASAPTMRLNAVPPETAVRGFLAEHDFPEPDPAHGPPPEEPPRRRWRTALLAVSGAAVAVVAAAGFASGLFSYDTPARNGALPDDVRASVPEPSSTSASATPPSSDSESAPLSSSPTASAPAQAAPVPSPSTSPSPSVSSSPSASATPSQSQSAGPSQSPTPTTATASLAPSQGSSGGGRAQTLRPGDKGPEVTELQLRLSQLSLYTGNTDGTYSSQVEDAVRRYQWARGITGDEAGVYGAATRASLEGETREP